MNIFYTIFIVIIIAALAVIFLWPNFPNAPSSLQNLSKYAQIIIQPPKINQSQLASYALATINKDRLKFGLPPVTLSTEPSAQQHADSMLQYGYFSHWDVYDMKPYMRYTLVGANESVEENVAYQSSSSCIAGKCEGNINPNQSIIQMEYEMIYNDSICCNNGHRDNILDPNHNQVSIGVAYNGSTIYMVQDFINNYINWHENTPAYGTNGEFYLNGTLAKGYGVYGVYVSYDSSPQNLTPGTVPSGPYSYGNDVAGVVSNSGYYYNNLTTIVADIYSKNGQNFDIAFPFHNLMGKYGAGVYTVQLTLTNQSGGNFVGSTYSVFINSQGQQYVPSKV